MIKEYDKNSKWVISYGNKSKTIGINSEYPNWAHEAGEDINIERLEDE